MGYYDNGTVRYLYPGGYQDIVDGIAMNITLKANPYVQIPQHGGTTIDTTQSIQPAPSLLTP